VWPSSSPNRGAFDAVFTATGVRIIKTPASIIGTPGPTAAVTAARRSRSRRQPVIVRLARAATPGSGQPGGLVVIAGQRRNALPWPVCCIQ